MTITNILHNVMYDYISRVETAIADDSVFMADIVFKLQDIKEKREKSTTKYKRTQNMAISKRKRVKLPTRN